MIRSVIYIGIFFFVCWLIFEAVPNTGDIIKQNGIHGLLNRVWDGTNVNVHTSPSRTIQLEQP
jgi:hypothetical protein